MGRAWLGLLIGLCTASAAQAQQACETGLARAALDAEARDFGLLVELAGTHRENERDTQLLWSPRVLLCYRLGERFSLEVDWGAAFLTESGDEGPTATTFTSSDPMLALRYAVLADRDQRLSVSVGATAPLAFADFDAYAGQRRASLAYAAGVRGLWDAYLWAPSEMGAALGAVYDRRLAAFAALKVEADVAGTFNVGDATQDDGDLYAQAAAEFIGGASGFHWAVRVQGSAFTSESDPFQLSIAPYVGGRIGDVALRGQVVLNIDQPLGVYGTGLAVWGVLLSAQGAL